MRNAEVNPIDFETTGKTPRTILHVEFYCFIRLAAALVFFVAGLFFPGGSMAQMLLMLLCFLLAAYDVVMKSVEEITIRRNLTMEPLILLASLAAFVVRLEVDGAALMFLYRVCTLVLDYAVGHTEDMLRQAVDPRPATVCVAEDEVESQIDRDAVRPGDTVILKSKTISAVDCIVLDGSATILCPWLRGENVRQTVGEGDLVPAGAFLEDGELSAEAMGPASASLLERRWNESRSEEAQKTAFEHWAELYKKYFAPVALALGAVVTVLLNMIGKCSVSNAIHRALCIVILMNPAGLLAALSVTAHAGVGGALTRGILFKGGESIKKTASAAAVVLDKNGTVTTGKYHVDSVAAHRLDAHTLLKAAAHAAANANTPLACAVVDAYTEKVDYSIIGNFVEYPDGLSVEIEDIPVLLGQRSFLMERGVDVPGEEEDGTVLHVSFAGQFAGSILLSETLRDNVPLTVDKLQELGCADVVLLSAGSTEKTHALARISGIDNYYANCGPEEKLARLSEIRDRYPKASALYVTADGTGDECLLYADMPVLLGDVDMPGHDNARLMLINGDLGSLPEAISRAKLIKGVFLQALAAIAGVKLLLIILALSGISSLLWFDVFVDGCVSIAAVLNAIRAFPPQKS